MTPYQSLTLQGKQAYLQALQDVGWFDYPQNDLHASKERLDAWDDQDAGMLRGYYLSLCHIRVDSEDFYNASDYEWLIGEVVRILAVPVHSYKVVLYERRSAAVATIVIGRTYRYILEMGSDWIDTSFLDFINDLFREEGIEARLLTLPLDCQSLNFVMVPEALYDMALARGIIPTLAEFYNY